MTMSKRRYKNPPIVEAVCAFRFEPGEPWDLTVVGAVYAEVQDNFPKKRLVKSVGVAVGHDSQGAVQQRIRTTDRMWFLRDDEKALMQVDRNFLSINHLKPYPTWEEFLPLIQEGFHAYRRAARPKSIRSIELRYINRIEFPSDRIGLQDYFEFTPFVNPHLSENFNDFHLGVRIPYEGDRDVVRVELFTASAETAGNTGLVLDLSSTLDQPGDGDLDRVFEFVELAHSRIEEAFEACIKDSLRKQFQEI